MPEIAKFQWNAIKVQKAKKLAERIARNPTESQRTSP